MDYSPPGSSVHGISQARILERVAMPSSRASSWPRGRTKVSGGFCTDIWILYRSATWESCLLRCSVLSDSCDPTEYIACQTCLSMEFPRQECWSGFLFQGIFPTQGSNPHLLTTPALAGGFFTLSATWEAPGLSWVLVIYLIIQQMTQGYESSKN